MAGSIRVTEYTINTLFKKRSEIIRRKKEEDEMLPPRRSQASRPAPSRPEARHASRGTRDASADAAAARSITVTTPPISVASANEMGQARHAAACSQASS